MYFQIMFIFLQMDNKHWDYEMETQNLQTCFLINDFNLFLRSILLQKSSECVTTYILQLTS